MSVTLRNVAVTSRRNVASMMRIRRASMLMSAVREKFLCKKYQGEMEMFICNVTHSTEL